MGALTHAEGTVHPRVDWLRLWASFLVHQMLSSWGVVVAAPWILFYLQGAGYLVGLRVDPSRIQWLLYGTPYFPAYVLIALALGWLLSGWLRHRSILWVWVLPLLALCAEVAKYPQTPTPSTITVLAIFSTYPWQQFVPVAPSGVGVAAALSHFFGWGPGFQPYDQVLVVVPFYTSAAYSLGALLARRVSRTAPFFESLRRVRVWRLALSAGLPWFLIEGADLWEKSASRLLIYRTAVGFLVFLGVLLIGSASLILVLTVSVALVGPRFGVTRFFIGAGADPAGLRGEDGPKQSR